MLKILRVKDGLALSGFYDFDELQKWLEKKFIELWILQKNSTFEKS